MSVKTGFGFPEVGFGTLRRIWKEPHISEKHGSDKGELYYFPVLAKWKKVILIIYT